MRDWQGAVLDLVRSEGADKRSRARVALLGRQRRRRRGDGRRLRADRRPHRRRGRGRRRHHRRSASGCWRRCSATPPSARSPTRAREDLQARADVLLRYEQDRFDAWWPPPRPPAAPPTSCAPPSPRWPRPAGRPRERRTAAESRWPTGWPRCARRSRSPRGGSRCRRSARPAPLLAKAGARVGAGRRHRRRARRGHRQREVDAVQRAVRRARSARRACAGRRPASRTPRVWGDATAPTGCSTGWRCRAGTGTPPSPRWTGWSCSTCPTTTASGWSTGWRSTAWSGWSTSWSGCSTRRSTPTPRCTTATWRRWPAHAGVLLVVLNQVDRLDDAAAAGLPGRPARACWTARGWPATPLLAVSARTGAGVAELRGELGPAGGRPAGGDATG